MKEKISKYKELIDGIKQNPDSLKKLHDNVDNIMKQSTDSYVQIEKGTNEYKNISVNIEKRKNIYLIAKIAAGFILIIFTVSFIMHGGLSKRPAGDILLTPTPKANTYPDDDTITMTKEGVAELFEEGGPLYNTEYTEEDCYNITKDEIKEKTGATILVYKNSGLALCVYNDEITILYHTNGLCDTGDSITDMEVTDLDNNGEYELTYATAWYGSGLTHHGVTILELDTLNMSNVYSTILNRILLKKVNDNNIVIYSNDSGDMGNLIYSNKEYMFIVAPIEAYIPDEKPEHVLWGVTADIDHDNVSEHFLFGYQNDSFTLEYIELDTVCVFSKENSEIFKSNVERTSLLTDDLDNDGIDEIIIKGYKNDFLICSIKKGKLIEVELPKYNDKFEIKGSSEQYELYCSLNGMSTHFSISKDEYKTTFTEVNILGVTNCNVSIHNNKKVFVLDNAIQIKGIADEISGNLVIYLSYDGNEMKIVKQELKLYGLIPNQRLYPDEEGVTQTKEGIAELFEKGGPLYNTEYTAEDCYNITKEEIKDKTGAVILVYRETGKVICVYNNEVTVLLENNGFNNAGDSITDIECTDLDKNGVYELVYSTIRHGSGIDRNIVHVLDLDTMEINSFVNIRRMFLLKTDEDSVLIYSKGFYSNESSSYLVYENDEFKIIDIANHENPTPTSTPIQRTTLWESNQDIDNDGNDEHFTFRYSNDLYLLECKEYNTICAFSKESSDYFKDYAYSTSVAYRDLNSDGIDEIIIVGFTANHIKLLFAAMQNGNLVEVRLPNYIDKFELSEVTKEKYKLECTLNGWNTEIKIPDEYKANYKKVISKPSSFYFCDEKYVTIVNEIIIEGDKYCLSGYHYIFLSYDGNSIAIEKQSFDYGRVSEN